MIDKAQLLIQKYDIKEFEIVIIIIILKLKSM